jgi:tRNA threonylcarbamoyladenosine biosynthesis protein TsaE
VESSRQLGAKLGRAVKRGMVVSLIAELGLGKTYFSKGVAEGMGIDPNTVVSPTFTLLNIYPSPSCPLFHFDLYRLNSYDELIEIGYDEYLEDGVVLLEWANKIPEAAPLDHLEIRLAYIDEHSRTFEFQSFGPSSGQLLQTIAAGLSDRI